MKLGRSPVLRTPLVIFAASALVTLNMSLGGMRLICQTWATYNVPAFS
jgi:hypothetical protein